MAPALIANAEPVPRRAPAIAAGLAVLGIGASVLVGFVGATGAGFDWALFAQIATAVGTVLLAGYTARLATATRSEVSLAVEEQRARDRPIVVAIAEGLGEATLEQTWGQKVPALTIRFLNVGLGPALDMQVEVRYRGARGVATETVSVLPVDTETLRAIPLVNIAFPGPDQRLDVEDFVVSGWYGDRTGRYDHKVVTLADRGLRDLQRKAERQAALRANPYFSPGAPGAVSGDTIEYAASIGNTAAAPAEDVTLQFRDGAGKWWSEIVRVGDVVPRRGDVEVSVSLPAVHPALDCVLTWRDGLGEHCRKFDAYQERRPVQIPLSESDARRA